MDTPSHIMLGIHGLATIYSGKRSNTPKSVDTGYPVKADLRYQGTPNDNIAFSPFERQAFHKNPNKLYIF